jgi:transposase
LIRGLLTDEEWFFFEPFMVSANPFGGRPARDHRRVLDAIFWIARTGAPGRDLPAELGNWNSSSRGQTGNGEFPAGRFSAVTLMA